MMELENMSFTELTALARRQEAELKNALAWNKAICDCCEPAERPAKAQGAADPVVEANRALLLERSQLGMAKYGTTLAGADLGRPQLLRHLLEELLDAANYAQAELMREAAAPSIQALPVVATNEPVAWLQLMESDRPFSKGEYFDVVILNRDACKDGMNLYAAAQPEAKEAPAALDVPMLQSALREIAACANSIHSPYIIELAKESQRILAAAGNSQDAKDAARDRVRDAVAENLSCLYHCGRVWSAWGYGTMSEDDFSPADQDEDIIASITDAAIAAMAAAPSPAERA